MTNPSTEDPRLTRLTEISLALPGAVKRSLGQHADFRVRNKVFAYYLDNHHGDGIVAVTCRTARGEHRDWVAWNPAKFYLPPYLGPRGWVALRLDLGDVDWTEVAEFVIESYRLIAPKRLATQVRMPSEGVRRQTH